MSMVKNLWMNRRYSAPLRDEAEHQAADRVCLCGMMAEELHSDADRSLDRLFDFTHL